MSITQNDFKKIWASTSSVPEYTFSDADYRNGWEFVGELPPTRAMWDTLQRRNDQKMKYLQDNGSMCFDSVADMVSTDLESGQTVITKGYYSVNDGGAGLYNIRAAVSGETYDDGSLILLDNGNVAELIVDGFTDCRTWGASVNNTNEENLAIINAMIASDKVEYIFIPSVINYGYKRDGNGPRPNLVTDYRKIIKDYSIDNSYLPGQPNTAQATQERTWVITPDPINDGMNDSGIIAINGNNHVNLFISNCDDHAEHVDGHRASLFFGSDAIPNWRIGQGQFQTDKHFIIARCFRDNGVSKINIAFKVDYDNATVSIGEGKQDGHPLYPIFLLAHPKIVDQTETIFEAQNDTDVTRTKRIVFSLPNNLLRLAYNGNIIEETDCVNFGKNFYQVPTTGATFLFKDTNDTLQQIVVGGANNFRVTDVGRNANLFELPKNGKFAYGVTGGNGVSTARPTDVSIGTMWFDSTIGKPIWWQGERWVDATGTTV